LTRAWDNPDDDAFNELLPKRSRSSSDSVHGSEKSQGAPGDRCCRSGLDLFLVPISSQLSNTAFPLKQWRAAGLNVPCGVKTQIATVEEKLVVRTVGVLAAADSQLLDKRLRIWLQLHH